MMKFCSGILPALSRVTLALFVCTLAGASFGQSVSSQTLLTELPKTVGIAIKRDIIMKKASDGTGFFVIKGMYIRHLDYNTYTWLECQIPHIFTIESYFPAIFAILDISSFALPSQRGDYSYFSNSLTFKLKALNFEPQLDCELRVQSLDRPMPKSVGDAREYFQDVFDFINLDPYSDLDRDTAVSILMKKITKSMETNDYKSALLSFLFLQQKEKHPPEGFFFYYAKALKETGRKDMARRYCELYLHKYGKTGKYYVEVVGIMAEL